MSNFEVDILVRGRPIRQFKHKNNMFVEGRKGSEFELKFTNNTWQRIEIVPSVDGLSVMDGEECGIDSSGYLVPAKQSIVIPGWRLDDDNIAKFVFKGKDKSYSAKSGHGTENVGAIGFMVFNEYVYYPSVAFPMWNTNEPYYGGIRSSGVTNDCGWITTNHVSSMCSSGISNSVGKGAKASSVDITPQSESTWNLGVGFGDQDGHKVHEVAFTRANATIPNDIITVYYDSKNGLESRGIQVVKTKKRKATALPNPFPTYDGSGCTPPPGWKNRR